MRGLSGHHPHRDGFRGGAARREDHDRSQAGIDRSDQAADGAGLFHQRRPSAGRRSAGRRAEDGHQEVAGLSSRKSATCSAKPMPALPEVSIPRFTGKAQYASRVWFPDLLYVEVSHLSASARAYQEASIHPAAEKMPGVAYILTYKNAPKPNGPGPAGFRAMPEALPAGAQSARRSGGHRGRGDRRSGRGRGRRDSSGLRSASFRIHAEGHHGARCGRLARGKRQSPAASPTPRKSSRNATWADRARRHRTRDSPKPT